MATRSPGPAVRARRLLAGAGSPAWWPHGGAGCGDVHTAGVTPPRAPASRSGGCAASAARRRRALRWSRRCSCWRARPASCCWLTAFIIDPNVADLAGRRRRDRCSRRHSCVSGLLGGGTARDDRARPLRRCGLPAGEPAEATATAEARPVLGRRVRVPADVPAAAAAAGARRRRTSGGFRRLWFALEPGRGGRRPRGGRASRRRPRSARTRSG